MSNNQVTIRDVASKESHTIDAQTAVRDILSVREFGNNPDLVIDGDEPNNSDLTVDCLRVGCAGYVWDSTTEQWWLSVRQ